MPEFLRRIDRTHLFLFLCGVQIAAMVYSLFLLSVSMFGLVLISVFHWRWERPWSLGLNPQWRANWRRFSGYRAFPVVTLFFFLVLVSIVGCHDFVYWSERLRVKMPFLVLPFAFASLGPLTRRQFLGLFYWLLLVLLLTSLGIGVHYGLHFEEINALLKQGRPMPTPGNHIRFSLILALGTLAGGYLYRRGFYWRHPAERHFILGATIFLFVFLHLLSVRSGLVALYLALFVLLIRHAYRTRRYLPGGIVLLLLAATPFAAYHTIPSFRGKIDYARYEIWVRDQGMEGSYSDNDRLTSIRVGLDIGREHPLLGVGLGNLRKEVRLRYALFLPEEERSMMPHNQFVMIFAGSGLLGLLVFGFALFYPLWYRQHYRHGLFLGFYVIVLASLMVEITLETSLGVAFYLFFLLLCMNYLQTKGSAGPSQVSVG